ncbi:NAC domain-containing protein 83-like isoform X2 [Diospyros lotus]|uniref:NAC domain-containing protein 83-like isoform X2 n=1 Tax=Diospyros lotus TaxID=55363 RepID=UPI00225017B2|nr:NAC domain-containing protein 83-like isoform X2 [Diospyros lotus]
MDKLNFLQDGALKLPPGFRFQPTDEEIVFQYLARKTFSSPLPASVVPEISLCKYDPWDFPGGDDEEQDRYFFTKKEPKYGNGNRSNRTTGSGYWKASGTDKRITSSKARDIMGMRKTLVFHRGKPPHGSRTDWIIHEYRLVNSATSGSNLSTQALQQVGNWVFCRLFLKKRGTDQNEERAAAGKEKSVRKYEFMRSSTEMDDADADDDVERSSSSSSSSNSSCGSSFVTNNEATSSHQVHGFNDQQTNHWQWL